MKVAIPLILATIAMSIQASAETLPTATSTAPSTDMSSAAWSACSRFQPGHYVFISDDKSRNVDGLKSLQNFLSKDVSSFKGVHYEVTWGSIEKSPGVYDFSRIDAALAQVKAKKKYLQMFFRDRTFHTGCNSNFVPSYVNKEGSYASSSACYAKIWEKTTMDHMIRVLKQVALRYKDDPNILGITLAETSVGALSMKGHPEVRRALDAQLKRVYPAVHSVAPSLIVHQMMNWGTDDSIYALTNDLAGIGGGGAMGWPDTVPSKVNEWHWYRIGREYNRKVAVIPHVQTGYIGSSLSATDQIYTFLVNDIGAHMVVWATWHKDMGSAYLTDVVIPTVNKYKGAVKNTTCPW